MTPKVIADPLYGIVDIRPVLPMVETEEFQALGDKRQLGMAFLTFPSATHTRKAHSLGSYHATREFADRWIKRGFINRAEADALVGYALYHDVGHPPLSHVTEPFCATPAGTPKGMSINSALSLDIIRRRKKEIKACNIDFKLLESMASYENPLHLAVSDKNLGMEKMDYLERDGLFTILSRPVGLEYLRHHIYFTDGMLTIDEKVVDNAIELQNYYLKIYKNVYLRKTSAIAQRMVQKMVYHAIGAGELSPKTLGGLTDSELFGTLHLSRNPLAKELYGMFRRRDLFRETVVVRPKAFAQRETRHEKHVAVFGVDDAALERLQKNPAFAISRQKEMEHIESGIAKIAGIPPQHILILPMVSVSRFEAQDILVYQGSRSKPASLRARYPAHFKNIEETGRAYLAFRVCTTEAHRKTLGSPAMAKRVFEYIAAL